MQSTANASLAELLQCSICLDTYTRPKVLPCQHTYCLSCLLSLCKDKNTVTCPQCREVHDIPKTGLATLKDSLVINNLLSLSIHKEDIKCFDCQEVNPVVSLCTHCDNQVCGQCLLQHIKLSSELGYSLCDWKDHLRSEESRLRLDETRSKLQESMEGLKNEVFRMKKVFDEAIQKLISRRGYIHNFVEVVLRIYADLLRAPETNESYITELSHKLLECRTIESLQRLKDEVLDLKTTSRLILQMRDDQFKFVGESEMLNLETFGRIEFGQATMDIRGRYEVGSGSGSNDVREETENLLEERKVSEVMPAKVMKDVQTWTDFNADDDVNSKTGTTVESDTRGQEEQPAMNQGGHLAGAQSLQVVHSNLTPQRYNQNQLPVNVNYKMKGRGSKTIIGQGKYAKDETTQLDSPAGTAYHVARDEIYVTDITNDRVMVYDSKGRNGRVFYSDVRLRDPRDVAISGDGERVFVVLDGAMLEFTLSGELVQKTESFCQRALTENASVVTYQNLVGVVDSHHHCVIVYNEHGEYVRHFGARVLKKPVCIAINGKGDCYVTDFESSCVHVFKWNGQYLETFGQLDNDRDIVGITVDGDGYVCVSRYSSHHIDVYDPQRRLLTSFGEWGVDRGFFNRPSRLCLMPDGRLIVSDRDNHRLQIF